MEKPELTESECQSMLDQLNARFNQHTRIQWTNRKGSSYGLVGDHRDTIMMGFSDYHTNEFKVLHEFAHAMVQYRFGTCRPNGQGPHGQAFRDCLLEVIKFWLKDIKLYDWSTEYIGVKKWGLKLLASERKAQSLRPAAGKE